jgi:excisionase family DNA binding protein
MKHKPAMLTPKEVARYLRINLEVCYRKLLRGQIPGVRIGRTWRIPRRELMASLRTPKAQGRIEAASLLAQERACELALGAKL